MSASDSAQANSLNITGRWGTPTEVLLDLTANDDGTVHGIVNPGRQNALISRGHFDAGLRTVTLSAEHMAPDGETVPIEISGTLKERRLHLSFRFGETTGNVEVGRIEDYAPRPLPVWDRLQPHIEAFKRKLNARHRPNAAENARALRARGETLESIIFRDALEYDIPALAELHVETWNRTYHVKRGPTIATRTAQWEQIFAGKNRRDFVLVLEDRNRRLIGFTWGRPHDGEFAGELSKIYLRWEYHGLGLGRRMMAETAKRFLARGTHSFILFAELSNPTIGFYDHLGGERLYDDRGQFNGGYGWRNLKALLAPTD